MSVSGIGQNYYQNYATENKKVSGKEKFALEKTDGTRELSEAAESRGASGKTGSSVWAGDMVIPQPPNYSGFTYDSSISSKSKEEMTMDEYKQWFMNETSQMPVSAWVRSTIVGGSLTITEECFERMKNDPEWENTVLGMVRKMYSVNGIMGAKAIGYQVIGASPEQCYGEGIPVKGGSLLSADKGESWWEKRHKKMEELMEEQEKEAVKKRRCGGRRHRQSTWKARWQAGRGCGAFLRTAHRPGRTALIRQLSSQRRQQFMRQI